MTLSLSMMAPGEALLRAREAALGLFQSLVSALTKRTSRTPPSARISPNQNGVCCRIKDLYPDSDLLPDINYPPGAPDGAAFDRKTEHIYREALKTIAVLKAKNRWSVYRLTDKPAP
jgi:hypothetical protein